LREAVLHDKVATVGRETQQTMKLYSESQLLNGADPATILMADNWHRLCREHLPVDLEVCCGDFRDDARFANSRSLLTSSEIRQVGGDGRHVLVLMLHSVDPVEDVLITHELGHNILRLLNFCTARPLNRAFGETAAWLNSLSQHPAIYALQRQHRQDPGRDIDNRARFRTTELLASIGRHFTPPLVTGLQLADDLMHASAPIADELRRLARTRAPSVLQVAHTVCEVASGYDLTDVVQHEEFLRSAVAALSLGTDWVFGSEVPLLRADLANAERRRRKSALR
jgi:hypothetical protein